MSEPVKIGMVANYVNEPAIDALEKLLDRLRSGQATAIAFVEISRGGLVSNAYFNPPHGEYHRLLSGAARLLHRIAGEPEDC